MNLFEVDVLDQEGGAVRKSTSSARKRVIC